MKKSFPASCLISVKVYLLFFLFTITPILLHAKNKNYTQGYIITNDGAARVFLRVVLKNEALTYYQWEYIDADNGYLDYIPLFYRTGSDEMVRASQGVLGLKKKRLMEYFGDCQDMTAAIEGKALNEVTDVYYFYLDRCMVP